MNLITLNILKTKEFLESQEFFRSLCMRDTMIPPVIMLLTGPVQNMMANRKIMSKKLLEETCERQHTNVNMKTKE